MTVPGAASGSSRDKAASAVTRLPYTRTTNSHRHLVSGSPEELLKTGNILSISVGTDQTLAMQTRRGTGFYKVPSLRGVWYRNGFGHGGQAETLEEWFDPARLQDNSYVPKGFHLGPGPIKGHEFGLKL